jgi:hypothetical protein
MELQTVEIPRRGAREAAAEYSRHARHMSDPVQRAEFEELARVYRVAAKEDIAIIALTPTIAAGGTVTRTVVYAKGTDRERRENYLLPALAVARGDARFCYSLGVQRDGSIELVDRPSPAWNYRSGVFKLDTGFSLPAEYKPGSTLVASWSTHGWQTMVPLAPPKVRPRVNASLRSYAILWEVDEWTWSEYPRPPRDPALLRHLGGDFYAVLATWDLTELERLVLSGRRPE